MTKWPFLVVPMIFGALATAEAAVPASMPLLAHRAVYDLKLDSASGDKGPESARGRIVYDFSGSACEGYVSNFRQINEVTPHDADANLSDVSTQTFEGGNGKSYQFRVQSMMNEKAREKIDGSAEVTNDGSIKVKLRQPKPEDIDLGKNVLFPTAHISKIIEAAKAGQKTLSARVYDGSEPGRKMFDTLTVIGPATTSKPSEPAAQIPQLEGVRRWPVTISYFASGPGHDTPDYTLAFDLYENGVSRKLKLDYGSFILDGTLVKLNLLPKSAPCNQP